jgi:hypothetical protein
MGMLTNYCATINDRLDGDEEEEDDEAMEVLGSTMNQRRREEEDGSGTPMDVDVVAVEA